MGLASRATALTHQPLRLEYRSDEALRYAVASVVVAVVLFSCRVGARLLKMQTLVLSDWWLLVGLVFHLASCSLGIWGSTENLGRHIEVVAMKDPSLKTVERDLKVLIVIECFYAISMISIKISILAFYRTLFPIRSIKIASNILGAIVVAWGLALSFTAIFGCSPIQGAWDLKLRPKSKCVERIPFMIGIAIPNTLTDVGILCLPIRQVWKLHLDRKAKIALTITFLLGSFVCIASIIRITVILRLDEHDLTWTLMDVANWSSLELAFAVASACLPTLRPLLEVIIPKSLRTKISGSGSRSRRTHNIPEPILLNRFSITATDKSDRFERLNDGV